MKNINTIKVESEVKGTNKFLNNLYTATSKGRTENDAVTFTRSGSPLLDFFAQGGAMRKNPDKALELFKKAFAEDREKAIRILFYFRDIRGGQGERTLFRVGLEWLGTTYPTIFETIVKHVPEYGRWDDVLFDNDKCFELIHTQLIEDKESETPSLLAKWLPTINASSKTTRAKARFVAEKLGYGEVEYRKTLKEIRKTIKTVEAQMSARKWEDIDYSHVPSQASRIYRNAFSKHDEVRYGNFIEKAEKGEEKINAGTLYPYQIYNTVRNDYSQTLEALWNQLPDYTQGKNALVVADVSGSMGGDPMSVSVSLALYFAERNTGQFKDHFITFSGNPTLQRIVGENLQDKMNSIQRSNWEYNTNLQAVFDLLLNTAVANNTPRDELPETIYIISDMEFDEATSTRSHWYDEVKSEATNYEEIERKYADAGYTKPNIVFWNVDARGGDNLPVQAGTVGVSLVSGFSPSVFKMAVENKTPEEVMLDTINSERYSPIVLRNENKTPTTSK